MCESLDDFLVPSALLAFSLWKTTVGHVSTSHVSALRIFGTWRALLGAVFEVSQMRLEHGVLSTCRKHSDSLGCIDRGRHEEVNLTISLVSGRRCTHETTFRVPPPRQ